MEYDDHMNFMAMMAELEALDRDMSDELEVLEQLLTEEEAA